MSIEQAVANAAYQSGNILIPALPSGLVSPLMWSYFTASLAASQNQGNGGAYSNIGPGPTYNSGYAAFMGNPTAGSALALQGPNDPGGSFTALFVAENTATPGPGQILSSEPTNGTVGAVISLNNNNTIGLAVSIRGAGIVTTFPIAGGTLTWSMYAVVFTSGTGVTIYDLGRGVNSGNVASTFARTAGTVGWQIGTCLSASADTHLTNIAWLSLYQAALTGSQLTGLYAAVKNSLKYRGILLP